MEPHLIQAEQRIKQVEINVHIKKETLLSDTEQLFPLIRVVNGRKKSK